MTFGNRLVWIVVLTVGVWTVPSRADQLEKPPVADIAETLKSDAAPAAATIDAIMEQAVRNIAARYNLNDVQAESTRQLMKRDVYKFLKEHENEVWPAIRDLLAAQLGAKPPDSREDVMRIGKASRPLAKLAEEAIFRANEEWRLILTQQQKDMHDFDLVEMRKTFEVIDKNLGGWEEGDPLENRIFPDQKQLIGRQPPRPHRPRKGHLPEPTVEFFDPHPIFETLVEEFIKEYELDEGQITSARSILEEFKVKANDFRDAKKLELAKIAVQQQDALARRDLKAIKQTNAAHKKLLEPVYELCDEMDGRLKGLLTTSQIQRHAEKSKARETSKGAPKVTKKTSPKKKTTSNKSESAKAQPKTANDNG